MTANTPAIVIDKLGKRFFKVTNNITGQVTHKWHWETLEQEVKEATLAYESNLGKKDLVVETETKVKATRAKKSSTVAK